MNAAMLPSRNGTRFGQAHRLSTTTNRLSPRGSGASVAERAVLASKQASTNGATQTYEILANRGKKRMGRRGFGDTIVGNVKLTPEGNSSCYHSVNVIGSRTHLI